MIFVNYANYYYKNKAAQENNKKSYYKNIDYIYKYNGNIIINGKAGKYQMLFYNVREAIKKYNDIVKNENKYKWEDERKRQILLYGYVWDPDYMTEYEKQHKKEIRSY